MSATTSAMSSSELRYCSALRSAAHNVLNGTSSFTAFVLAARNDGQALRGFGSADALLESGYGMCLESLTFEPRQNPTPLERTFLEDVIGLVDYVVRNGIDFNRVISAVAHDVREIGEYGSLDKAVTEGFVRPVVSGWAERNKTPVGEPESGE